jgi:tripartite-type tricarboxylate transporter receptor subunit TctC
MALLRRQFLQLAASAAALSTMSRFAWAQAYPSRPVRIVVGVPAGGTFDIVARLIGQWLSERLGQQFIIENRPGAATNVGTDLVAHAPADGYTLLLTGSPNAINATLYDPRKLNYNFIRDIAPVASIERMPLVMAVNPAFPAKTVPEFISYAKANPARVNQGSGGIGSTGHVSGELFKMMTGVTMAHVPYRGEAPALTDLLGEQVQVVFSTAGSLIGYLKAGSLRPLAVTTRRDWLCSPTFRRSRSFCRAMKRAPGAASGHPAIRPWRSSTGLTRRSTPALPIPS